jgi:iron complex outermembrane receptor protein
MTRSISSALCGLLVLFGLPFATAHAQSAALQEFSIPAQPLSTALIEFSRQAHVQVLTPGDQVEGVRTRGIEGRFAADAAISRLLQGSGLDWHFVSDGVITITRTTPAAPAPPASAGKPPAGTSAAGSPPPTELAAVQVTGSRLKRTDFEGPSPVITLSRQKIEQSGASTVRDLLNALPQNSVATDESGANTGLGSSTIQLRGLSVGSTLILINGRRVSGYTESYFDLNSLPLEVIERVEVLTDTASAVYGADAIGGAVNFITKKDYQGAGVSVRYGTSAQGDATEREGSLSLGGYNDTYSGMMIFSVFDRDPLYARSRELSRSSDFRRFGGTDNRSTTAYPANVYALPGTGNLPGLNNSFAGVPAGGDGVGLTPSDFAATDGIRNRFDTAGYTATVPRSKRVSAFASAEAKIASTTHLFGEFLFSRNHQATEFSPDATYGGANGIYTVGVDNPFNPFGVPVGVDYRFAEMGSRKDDATIDYTRLLAGARGTMFDRFDWEVSILADRNDATIRYTNYVNLDAVQRYLDSSDPATALNVFSTTGNNNPDTLAAITDHMVGMRTLQMRILEATLRGPVMTLPAGDIQFGVGANSRRDMGDFHTQGSDIAGNKESTAVFAETSIPLLSPDWNIPWIYSAEFTAALRRDNYDTFGSVTNPQMGFTLRPVPSLLLRASYGKAFKPPSLSDLYDARVEVPSSIPDPLRNGEVSNFLLIYGGNTHTRPERAKAFTWGAIWEPESVRGLSTGVTFFRIKHDNLIGGFDYNEVLTHPEIFGDRIVRGAATAEDIAAGMPGRLLSLDATTMNYGYVEVSGADLDLRYTFPRTAAGTFTWSNLATYIDKYNVQLSPDTPVSNDVGKASNRAGYPVRIKATSQLVWAGTGGWGASLAARYLHSYKDYDDVHTLPRQTLWDAQLTYDNAGRVPWLGDFRLGLGVVNLTDQQGHYAHNFAGYDFSQADLRGRYFYLTLHKGF